LSYRKKAIQLDTIVEVHTSFTKSRKESNMNNEKIASELVKIAKELSAAKPTRAPDKKIMKDLKAVGLKLRKMETEMHNKGIDTSEGPAQRKLQKIYDKALEKFGIEEGDPEEAAIEDAWMHGE